MKLTKKDYLNKTGKVLWIDACGHTNDSLKDVINKGFPLKETTGKICFIGKIAYKGGRAFGIIIQTEQCSDDDNGDYTIIPKLWVIGFTEMEVKL